MSRELVSETAVTALVAQLATNYGLAHTLEDETARQALVASWWTVLRGCQLADVMAARDVVLAQNHRMPAVAEFRAMVNQAADRRHRAPGMPHSGGVCAVCEGHQGYQDMGEDDHGRWFVQPCPNGCTPITHHEATRRGRTTPRGDRDPAMAAALANGLALLRESLEDPEGAASLRQPHRYTPPARQLTAEW